MKPLLSNFPLKLEWINSPPPPPPKDILRNLSIVYFPKINVLVYIYIYPLY